MGAKRLRPAAPPSRALALLLLLLAGAAVLLGQLADRAQRPIEGAIAAYFAAVTREDLAAALEHVVPERRAELAPAIANQLGNRYRVLGVAVRAPSLAHRLIAGAAGEPAAAVIQVDVTNPAGETWRASTVVRLRHEAGRWLLRDVPLD